MIWSWSTEELRRLETFLRERGLAAGELMARPIGDGHANLTFLVSDGVRELVLRRPPPPPTPPGANDMMREARLLRALENSEVPVPRVLAVDDESEVIDVPFYVMTFVEGVVVTRRTPPALAAPDVRRQIGYSMVDTLAALHAVDWRARGLEGFGRPEGFNARHVDRMARIVANAEGATPAEFLPLRRWLEANVPPESGAAILHSDYRLGNVMLAAEPPGRVLAVLDWELATIGDPLLDVGYLLGCYPVPGEPTTPTGDLSIALLERGFPARDELVERYVTKTGADVSNLRWYAVLALFKLAVLYEHSHRRAIAGVGDPYYADPMLVQRFLAAAHRESCLEPMQ
jgi:aminoglycoside phosphotransferase (APT) family kinase protein